MSRPLIIIGAYSILFSLGPIICELLRQNELRKTFNDNCMTSLTLAEVYMETLRHAIYSSCLEIGYTLLLGGG